MFSDEVSITILCNTPVDVLHELSERRGYYYNYYVAFGYHVAKLIRLLDDSECIRGLCAKYKLRPCVTFSDFLNAYNRSYMFRDTSLSYFSSRWHVNFLIEEIVRWCTRARIV